MLEKLQPHIERIRYYDTITGMSKIIRRYFVNNSFDGALTIFGLLLGSFTAGVTDPSLIIQIGIGTTIAIGFSGLGGALLTERAERTRELKSLEKALHRNLDNTDYKEASDFASVLTALVDGFSPLLAAALLLVPFFILPLPEAYYASFALALVVFFLLGVFLGRIAKENLAMMGFKFLAAGILCMVVILLLGQV